MKMEEEKVFPLRTMEEKMEQWRREADAKARCAAKSANTALFGVILPKKNRLEINEEVERMRKIEMSKIRLEENARANSEVSS